MSLINISNLTFSYENSYDDIFTGVSFQLDTDWKLGFCGRNGRGKTTFLNLLMGKYEYRGTISAGVNFEYFPFPVEDKEQMTIDILSQTVPEAEDWQFRKELFQISVSEEALYRPFSTLSNGEQTKVLLAGLFLRENSFLLIDEPTNHLDLRGRQKVAKYLNSKAGFILVSHDRKFLDECTDHTLSINKTNIEVISGNFSAWWQQKKRQDEFEEAQNEKLKKEIGRLEAASKRTAKWSNDSEKRKTGIDPLKVDNKKGWAPKQAAKSKKMMMRSKAIQVRQQSNIEDKSKLLKNIETADTLMIRPASYHTSRLISLENAAVYYDGRKIFHDMSFSVSQGERIALSGENGSGKSSILKMIAGQEMPHTGSISVGSGLIISYVPQDASFLTGNLKEYSKERGIDETLFKANLRKLDFSRVQFEKDMSDFSAGQKKKVLLAASLSENAHLYVWDEPLNYIDVLSRIQIEELLVNNKPTMLFVEHDNAFCEKVTTRNIELYRA